MIENKREVNLLLVRGRYMKYTKTDEQIITKFKKLKPWGLHCTIDLYSCNPKTIRDSKKIKQFVDELIKKIDMKKFGNTTVVDFGEEERVSGFSMTQLIETSLISGHFANASNAAYLDIFSCKHYPPNEAAAFAKKFFGAKKMHMNIIFRK